MMWSHVRHDAYRTGVPLHLGGQALAHVSMQTQHLAQAQHLGFLHTFCERIPYNKRSWFGLFAEI